MLYTTSFNKNNSPYVQTLLMLNLMCNNGYPNNSFPYLKNYFNLLGLCIVCSYTWKLPVQIVDNSYGFCQIIVLMGLKKVEEALNAKQMLTEQSLHFAPHR